MKCLLLAGLLLAAVVPAAAQSSDDPLVSVRAHLNKAPLQLHAAVAPAALARQQGPVEYSDAYGVRLTIHKYASLATVPLFIGQYLAGDELLADDPAGWAKDWHGGLAAGVAALFVVNTATGGWNLLEARRDPEGRTLRTVHGLLMIAADAGFVATGIAANSTGDRDGRERHRDIALASMGVSLVSYAIMLPLFRKD